MHLGVAEALYRLGKLAPERLGELGVGLLAADMDTPAVRELAGCPADATWRDVGDLFDRVLREVDRPPLSEHEAAYQLAEHAARAIVTGTVTPYEGAAQIAYGAYHAAGQPDDLARFHYWADEWEDHPEYRAACEIDIRREAATLLAARGTAA